MKNIEYIVDLNFMLPNKTIKIYCMNKNLTFKSYKKLKINLFDVSYDELYFELSRIFEFELDYE